MLLNQMTSTPTAPCLFIGSQSYNQTSAQLTKKINQRLNKDYQDFLAKLSKIVPAEHLERLPPLEMIRLNILPKVIHSPKTEMKLEKRCQALTETGQRCARQINSSSSIFCFKHLKDAPTNSLDGLSDCFKPILSASKTDKITEFQMMNLTQQKGRKYYQLPDQLRKANCEAVATTLLSGHSPVQPLTPRGCGLRKANCEADDQIGDQIADLYLPVTAVQIENQVYLKDPTGRLFGISGSVPLVGRTDGHLIKWYHQE